MLDLTAERDSRRRSHEASTLLMPPFPQTPRVPSPYLFEDAIAVEGELRDDLRTVRHVQGFRAREQVSKVTARHAHLRSSIMCPETREVAPTMSGRVFQNKISS